MLTLHRNLGLATSAGLVMLTGAALTPAVADPGLGAGGGGIADNALTKTALASNMLIASGSATGDLNGVAVEAITLPETVEY